MVKRHIFKTFLASAITLVCWVVPVSKLPVNVYAMESENIFSESAEVDEAEKYVLEDDTDAQVTDSDIDISNDKNDSYKIYTFGSKITKDDFAEGNLEDWRTFTLSKAELVEFELSFLNSTGYRGAILEVYNDEFSSVGGINRELEYGEWRRTIDLNLKAGTYYICLRGSDHAGHITKGTASYVGKIIDPQDRYPKYAIGETITKDDFSDVSLEEWKQFTMDKTGVVHFDLSFTNSGGYRGVGLFVYNTEKKLLYSIEGELDYPGFTKSIDMGLLKGEYYICLKGSDHAGYITKGSATYSSSYVDKDISYQTEEEYYDNKGQLHLINNSKETSIEVSDKLYNGLLTKDNSEDWYTFDVEDEAVITFNCLRYYNGSHSQKGMIYKDDNTYGYEISLPESEVYTKVLTKGKYYLSVSGAEAYSYSFRINKNFKKYKVKYYGNGAMSGSAPVDNSEYISNQKVSVARKGDLEFFGLKFLGWSKNPDADQAEYIPDVPSKSTIIVEASDINLYAIWEKPDGNKLSLNVYHNIADDISTAIPPYYLFNLDKETTLNISVHAESGSAISQNMVKMDIYDENGSDLEEETITPCKYDMDTIVFRRVTLPKGMYYCTVQNPRTRTYGFSDANGGIYITTYKGGFDLTKDSIPVINTNQRYDVLIKADGNITQGNIKRDKDGNIKKDSDGNIKHFLPDDAVIDVVGRLQYRLYEMEVEDPAYCFGFSAVALKEQLNGNTNFVPEKYIKTNLNTDGKDGYHPNYIEQPVIYNGSDLQNLLSRYVVWANCTSEGKNAINGDFLYCNNKMTDKNSKLRYQDFSNKIKDEKSAFIISIVWPGRENVRGGGHALLIDRCRCILDNPDGKGNTWHRIYLYDCNKPFEKNISTDYSKWKDVISSRYGLAEQSYMDFCDDGSWIVPKLGVNLNYNLINIGNTDGAEISFVDDKQIPETFNELNPHMVFSGDAGNYLWIRYINSLAEYIGNLRIVKGGEVVLEIVDGIVKTCSDEVKELSSIGANISSDRCEYMLPKENYSIELSDGEIELLTDHGYDKIQTNDKIEIEIREGSEVILKSENNAYVHITTAETNDSKSKYEKIRTAINVDSKPLVIKLQNGKASIESSTEQNIDIEFETESGDGIIENISINDVKDIEIRDNVVDKYSITFDSQGGNYVEAIEGILKATTVKLPTAQKDGFILEGWYTEPNGQGIKYTNNTPITQNVTLYANWSEIQPGIRIEGLDEGGYVYTGGQIKPDIQIYDESAQLIEKKDYTIAYKNNTKVYTFPEGDADFDPKKAPSITITGKGNYENTEVVYFKILPLEIYNDDYFSADDIAIVGTGKAQKIKPVLFWKDKTLKNKTDYTYDIFREGDTKFTQSLGDSVTDEGNYIVVLTGKGNFTDSREICLTVTSGCKFLKNLKISKIPAQPYTGSEIEPKPEVRDGYKVLTEDIEYTLRYISNINTGTGYVIIRGEESEGYAGVKRIGFKITGPKASKAGAYDISETKDITKRISITCDSPVEFMKGGAKPAVTVTFKTDKGTVSTLSEGRDYKLSYKNNTTYGGSKSPTAVVSGIGNFKGKREATFTITEKNLNTVSLLADDVPYKNKANIFKTKLTVVDEDGKALKAGKDYDKDPVYVYLNSTEVTSNGNAVTRAAGDPVDKTDIIPVDTVIKVTVNAKAGSGYTGSASGEYKITTGSIASAKVTIPVQTYTGKPIALNKSDITVLIKGAQLSEADYDIVGYTNNTQKGTAKVTIRGKGNYGGLKTQSFKIKAKGFKWWWRKK